MRGLLALALGVAVIAACNPTPNERPVPQAKHAKAKAKSQVPAHIAAIGDTAYLEPALWRAFQPHGDYEPMPPPAPDEWLAQHDERPQTYADFLQEDTRVPGPQRNVIYLLPIGAFPDSAPSIESLTKIVHAFFTLEVKVLPAVSLDEVSARRRISEYSGKSQMHAGQVLSWLTNRLPDDAFGLMAITMEDLYPEESWNYVFGMASLRERVGVQSFARQDPAFYGNPREAGWKQLALRRATWTMVHEISHMFGLSHCVHWRCVVAGSNSQAEADTRPLHPCPVCLRKLYSAIGFDPAAREEALAKVLRELGIDDEADWAEQRAKWIRGP